MKKIVLFCFVLSALTRLHSQDVTQDTANTIFMVVPGAPKFKGNLNKWLSKHIHYPDEAKDKNIQGTVYVSFVIEKNGEVSNVKLLQGVIDGKMLDDEALRVVSTMPKWKPGKVNGVKVRVQYNIPIKFVLR